MTEKGQSLLQVQNVNARFQ